MHVAKSITVNQPVAPVYEFWRDFENLPRFMHHLQLVEDLGGGRSHWTTRGPAGSTVEWDAEIIEEIPGESISWRSVKGSEIDNAGSVRFATAPGGRGTEIHVTLDYDPPAGKIGAVIAKLVGVDAAAQVSDDLRRFKQIVETGEVLRSDASPEGLGQGIARQRPAQPPAVEARA
jgi:uncharacterized membrane protein